MKRTTSTVLVSVLVFFTLAPAISLAASFFYVDDAGNVGIGNSTPQYKLDVSGAIYSRLVTATSSTISWGLGNTQSLTLTSSPTLTFANPQAGGEYTLILNQDSTGGRTVTWPASVRWPGGNAPVLSTAANRIDKVNFVYDGTNYLGNFSVNYQSSPSALLNNLVSYWKLDGNSNDSVGSNNGTDTSVTYSNANGVINNGGGFNGSTSHILLGSNSSMNVSGGAYSVCFWNKPNGSASGPYGIISRRESNTGSHPNEGWTILYANGANTKYELRHVTSGGITSTVSTTGSHATGSWYFECVTVDGSGNVAWYTNGSADGTGTITLVNNADSVNAYIGQGQDDGSTFLEDGAIDEVGVWNRQLSSSEVSTLYNSGSGLQYPF